MNTNDVVATAARVVAYFDIDNRTGNDGHTQPVLANRPALADLVADLRNALEGKVA